MKKAVLALFLVLALMLSLCACGAKTEAPAPEAAPSAASNEEPAAPVEEVQAPTATDFEVTDLLGRTVTIPANADAFACIGPGCLRLYTYVADATQLVGVEDAEKSWGSSGRPYTMSIEDKIADLPVIGPGGPGNAPDAELLFTANPDVIFTMYNSDVSIIDELQSKTGIPVVALSYGDTEVFDQHIYDSLTLIGKVTGHEDRATEVVAYMQNLATELGQMTANVENKPSVYLGCQSNRGSHGIESTVGNYILFDVLGIRNAAAEAGIPEYAMIDKEKIIEMDPDIIVIDAGGYQLLVEDYEANPEFYNSLRAFKEGKVFMQMPYNYYYTNLEIAMADAYYIGSVVYPELFANTDIQTKFAEISEFMLGMNCYDAIADEYYGGYQAVTLGN